MRNNKYYDKLFWIYLVPVLLFVLGVLFLPSSDISIHQLDYSGWKLLTDIFPIILLSILIPFTVSYGIMKFAMSKSKLISFFVVLLPIVLTILFISVIFSLLVMFPSDYYQGEGILGGMIIALILSSAVSAYLLLIYFIEIYLRKNSKPPSNLSNQVN